MFEKEAAAPFLAQEYPVNPDWGQHRNKLLQYLTLLGLGGVGLGAATTGGLGLLKLRGMGKRPEALPGNVSAGQAKPEQPPAERDEPEATEKAAQGGIGPFSARFLMGQAARSPWDIPWAGPAAVGVPLGGLLLGSGLAGHFIKKQMKKKQQAELEKAKQEFDEATLGTHRPDVLENLSEKTSSVLDQLYDALEKRGVDPVLSTPGAAGRFVGPTLAAMMLAGGAGMYGGHQWMEARKKERLLADALKRRAIIQAQASPAPISLLPAAPKKKEEGSED